MAEPFNAEQYRQQMSGQMPQVEQSPMMSAGAAPQPYQPQHMHMAQAQVQPAPYQPQPYAPQNYQDPTQHAWPPQPQQMMQPQTPIHHMPPPPVFAPPPGTMNVSEELEEAPKKSRFKRSKKVKAPKAKKIKSEASEEVHTTKTSPRIIFMFGMATGIVCFLAGNILMSNLLADNSAKSFREIERQNAKAQQPVLPKSAQNTESAARPKTP